MKSERRHELQTNTLADRIGDEMNTHGERLKLVGAGLIALFAIIFAYLYISQQSEARLASRWSLFFQAVNSTDRGAALERVAEEFKSSNRVNSKPALWTLQSLADIKLAIGAATRFTNKEDSLKDLEIAKQNFGIVRDISDNPLMRLRATYGLAQTHEALCEPEEAKKLYEEVKQQAGDSALATAAEEAISRIDQLQADNWYVWFKEQDVVKPEPVNPNLPSSLDDLPDRPDLDFNVGGGLFQGGGLDLNSPGETTEDGSSETPAETPGEEPGNEDKPAEETPAEPVNAKPAEEKPAEEKRAEEKPAEPKEAPAEEKPAEPAEEKPAAESPVEEKPVEEKPAEEKPAEEKPAEEKPAEEKPAEGGSNG